MAAMGRAVLALCVGLVWSENAVCRSQPGSLQFDCRFEGQDSVPDLEVESFPSASFQLSLHTQTQSGQLVNLNESECQKHRLAGTLGYQGRYVSLQQKSVLQGGVGCGIMNRSILLLCMPGPDPPPKIQMSLQLESNHPMPIDLQVRLQPSPPQTQNFALSYGGGLSRTAFHIFDIPDDPSIDLWRLQLSAHNQDELLPVEQQTSSIFLIHETSHCVSPVLKTGGCFDPVWVESCVRTAKVSFEGRDLITGTVAMHMSFLRQAALTLSKGSRPKLRPGRWVVFVKCGETGAGPCPETLLKAESYKDTDLQWQLAGGCLLVVLGTIAVLCLVNAIDWFAYAVLYRCSPVTAETEEAGKYRLWPVMFGRISWEHVEGLRGKVNLMAQPIPFFSTLLSLMLGVFLATTAQFVLTHYGLMYQTGNRDICFYNEMCYYPSRWTDLPWNNIISNLAYFVAGSHVICQAFFAETRCRTFSRDSMHALFSHMDLHNDGLITRRTWTELFHNADLNRNGVVSRREWRSQYGALVAAFDFIDENGDGQLTLNEWDKAFDALDRRERGSISPSDLVSSALESRNIDLRTFYAIGVAFIGEGIGSMCYHLCPSVETFQFDTCFMIPIANVLALALVDWRSSTKSDSVTALKYIMYILIPVWLINFVGTWYDVGLFRLNWMYWVFAALVIVWTTVVSILAIRRICQLPGRCGWLAQRVLQVSVVLVVAAAFLSPQIRSRYFSGTANLFLLLSILVMAGVIGRQMYKEDIRFLTCEARDLGARLIKNMYAAVMMAVATCAVLCFKKKVVLVQPGISPAESRDANADCVISIFDLHDLWHFLSAIALALFAMLLLDIRVNSWARRMGVQLLFEQPTFAESDSEVDPTSDKSVGSSSDSSWPGRPGVRVTVRWSTV